MLSHTLRKPQRLTFFYRNQVQLTDFQFGVTGFEFVSTGVELSFCTEATEAHFFTQKSSSTPRFLVRQLPSESNSIPVGKSEPPCLP